MRKSLFLLSVSALCAVAALALEVPANKIVDSAWLKKNISDKSLVLIMVDRDKTYEKKHIANSAKWSSAEFASKTAAGLYIDLPSPENFTALAQKSGINKDSVVVFYGSGTDAANEAKAPEGLVIAEHFGITKTAVLNGGLAGWEKTGGAVTAEVPVDKKGNFVIGKMGNSIMQLADVDKAVQAKSAIFVDARAEKYFKGQDDDKRLREHGSIEGAVNIPAAALYDVIDGVAYFKKADEVKAILQKAGVDGKKPLVAFCNTGHLTSSIWFAGKYIAGFKDAKNFKGSMVEYSNAEPARKVVKN